MREKKIFLFIIFIAILWGIGKVYNQPTNMPFKNDHLVIASNHEEVRDFLYKKTPGLKRAEREGMVHTINQQVKIPDGMGILSIDSIWYTSKDTYIFYHIKGVIPSDAIASLSSEDEKDHFLSYTKNMNLGEGILYKDTFYSRLTFGNSYREEANEAISTVVKHLSLNMTLRYEKKGVNAPTDDNYLEINAPTITFTVAYDANKEKTYTLPLDWEINIGDYGKMVLDQLIIEPQRSYFTFDFLNDHNYQVDYIAGTLTTDQGDVRKLWIPVSPTEKDSPFYQMEFDALDAIPASLSIQIDGMMLITNESIHFDIPVEKYHGQLEDSLKKEELNQILGTIDEIDIYLKEIWWDERGLSINILLEFDHPAHNPIDNISSGGIHSIYEQRRMEERYKGLHLSHVITVTDEKGKEAEEKHYGQRGSGPGQQYGIFIDRKFVEATKVMKVTLDHIQKRIVGPWKGKIKVKK